MLRIYTVGNGKMSLGGEVDFENWKKQYEMERQQEIAARGQPVPRQPSQPQTQQPQQQQSSPQGSPVSRWTFTRLMQDPNFKQSFEKVKNYQDNIKQIIQYWESVGIKWNSIPEILDVVG